MTNTTDNQDAVVSIAQAYAGRDGTSPEDITALVRSLRAEFGSSIPSATAAAAPVAEAAPTVAEAPVAPATEAPAPEAELPAAQPPAKAKPASKKTAAQAAAPAPKRRGRPRKTPAPEETAGKKPAKKSGEQASMLSKAEEYGWAKPDAPAIPVAESVTDDEVFCLHCGKGMKMLKRHLNQTHKQTPEEYIEYFGLPEDHLLTAPNYSKQKSKYAVKAGLGQHARKNEEA